jgi:HlyD family secretion protein
MDTATRRRLAFWAPLGAALVLALGWLLRPAPVAVDLVTAGRGPLRVTVSDEGETRVRDLVVISAPVSGWMQRIELEVGDRVEAGKTAVARIEPADPAFLDVRADAEVRAALEAAAAARTLAQAQLTRAEAENRFAAAEQKRVRALAERKLVATTAVEAADRSAETAAAAVAEARANLTMHNAEYEQVRARLRISPSLGRRKQDDCECVVVRSPVNGSVLRIVTESAGVVASGAPLIEIGDPEQLEIAVDLLSAAAVQVKAGQRTLIEAWGGDAALEGVVKRVEPYGFTKVSALGIEEQRVNVIIDITSPRAEWTRLGHGYRVEPSIVLWSSEDVLRVPLASLFRSGEGWAVFVADGGRAALRMVEIGRQSGFEAEVVSGLESGERIVLHPSDRITDGTRLAERG